MIAFMLIDMGHIRIFHLNLSAHVLISPTTPKKYEEEETDDMEEEDEPDDLEEEDEPDDLEDLYEKYPFLFNSRKCALPLTPKTDNSSKPEDGIRFGNTHYSRQEFVQPSSFMNSLKEESTFVLEFKTSSKESGVLFYVSGANQNPSKKYFETGYGYIGLLLQNGKIIYIFNCGTGNATITSRKTYNDGIWHRVVFSREGNRGHLVIDKGEAVSGSSEGSANTVNLVNSFYVGGLSEETYWEAKTNLMNIDLSFPGCIRNVEVQGEVLTSYKSILDQNISSCSNLVEEGTYFSSEGGYIMLYDKYFVGQNIDISFEIKPRRRSGIILAIHGPKDYLIAQLVDGEMMIEASSGHSMGASRIKTYISKICDGKWYAFNFTKINNTVTLDHPSGFARSYFLRTGDSSTDTNDPLYIGGLPASSLSKKGVKTRKQFVGCMRSLRLNNELQSLSQGKVIGQVTLNTCPTI